MPIYGIDGLIYVMPIYGIGGLIYVMPIYGIGGLIYVPLAALTAAVVALLLTAY